MDDERYWRLSERLQAISVAMFGMDGQNGLRSMTRENAKKLDSLEMRMREFEASAAQFRTVWVTIRWMGLIVGGAMAFILSNPVAGFITNIVRVGLQP